VRYIRKQAQVESFRIAQVVKSGPRVEVKLEPDPRSEIFASGFDGWIRLPENTQVVKGDYLVHENGCPDFVIPQQRFDWEYGVIGDGSTHSDEPLFPPSPESEKL